MAMSQVNEIEKAVNTVMCVWCANRTRVAAVLTAGELSTVIKTIKTPPDTYRKTETAAGLYHS